MQDFNVLSKQEFLNSYSYLTETEYNLTRAKQSHETEGMYLDETNTWRMSCGCTEANVCNCLSSANPDNRQKSVCLEIIASFFARYFARMGSFKRDPHLVPFDLQIINSTVQVFSDQATCCHRWRSRRSAARTAVRQRSGRGRALSQRAPGVHVGRGHRTAGHRFCARGQPQRVPRFAHLGFLARREHSRESDFPLLASSEDWQRAGFPPGLTR